MKVKICHSKYGVCFDGNVARIEAIEQDEDIRFVLTDWDGTEQDIVAKNNYTVLRIGDKEKAQKKKAYLGKIQTTWDLANDFDKAIKTLKDAGVDTEKIYFYLPAPDGWMKEYGPCSPEEAYKICKEYWDKQRSTEDGKTD